MKFNILMKNKKPVWLLVLVLLIAIIPLITNPYYTSLMIIIGIQTIVTVGLCLLMGYAGQVSLGNAAFYGTGAFISAILSRTYHISPWIALVLAAILTGLLAYIIGFPIFRLRGNYLAMATLAFGIIMYIIFVELKQFTGGPSGLSGVPYLSIAGFNFNSDFRYYYLVWFVCLLILFLSQNIINSRSGRALRAIHGSEDAAYSVGVDVAQFKIKVFVLSAVYASIAGSLYAHYVTFVSPQPFGFLFSVKLVVMAVVGGLASIWGSIFGTTIIIFLGDVLHRFGELDIILYGLILMVVMILMPQGIFRGIVALVDKIGARLRKVPR